MTRKLCNFIIISITAISCTTLPDGAKPIENFEKSKYLGTWYEIGRIDQSFEKNLTNVTATYSLNTDSSIKVSNSGFDTVSREWNNIVGKAKFAQNENIGQLSVSFFGPFYGGYNILSIDSNYHYALVVGNSTKYLWLLSRTPQMPESIQLKYQGIAQGIGCDIHQIVWVQQGAL